MMLRFRDSPSRCGVDLGHDQRHVGLVVGNARCCRPPRSRRPPPWAQIRPTPTRRRKTGRSAPGEIEPVQSLHGDRAAAKLQALTFGAFAGKQMKIGHRKLALVPESRSVPRRLRPWRQRWPHSLLSWAYLQSFEYFLPHFPGTDQPHPVRLPPRRRCRPCGSRLRAPSSPPAPRRRRPPARRGCSGTSWPPTGSSPADWPCPGPRCRAPSHARARTCPCRRRPATRDGSMPREPVSMAATSERMSPNMLPVTMTSNCFGARTSCMRGVVDVHVGERHVRIVARHRGDHFTPELGDFEHVGLVHRAQPPLRVSVPARTRPARCVRSRARCRRSVLKPAPLVVDGLHAPRLAEVDAAGELADDQDVEAGHQFALQRRRPGERREQQRRAQVGEQAELCTQSQQAALGTLRAWADRPTSGRPPPRAARRRRRAGSASRRAAGDRAVDGGAADEPFVQLQRQPGRLARRFHDLGRRSRPRADSVAGQNRNFMFFRHLHQFRLSGALSLSQRNSQGIRSRWPCSNRGWRRLRPGSVRCRRALDQQRFAKGSMSNSKRGRPGSRQRSARQVDGQREPCVGLRQTRRARRCLRSFKTIGNSPFLKQLLKNMSAKLGAMTHRKPYSSSAHTACSRLEPQPKLRPRQQHPAPW